MRLYTQTYKRIYYHRFQDLGLDYYGFPCSVVVAYYLCSGRSIRDYWHRDPVAHVAADGR